MKRHPALITGASQGIGRALAGVFAREGYDLVLVARNAKALKTLSHELEKKWGIRCWIFAQDLSRDDGPQKVMGFLNQHKLELDVLINNAGYGSYGLFSQQGVGEVTNMIDLNVRALTELTSLVLPGMLKRKRGKILQVASTAAFQPGPLSAVYFATKSFVLHFSEAIGNELIGTGVSVSTLCPGPTHSGFSSRANWDTQLYSSAFTSEAVAERGYRGLMNRKSVIYACSWTNRMMIWCERLVPRTLMVKITRYVLER